MSRPTGAVGVGISRDKSERWRLRNPDPDVRENIPGSNAKKSTEAFLAGSWSRHVKDKVTVIHEIYRYLGLPVPELEELLPPERGQTGISGRPLRSLCSGPGVRRCRCPNGSRI